MYPVDAELLVASISKTYGLPTVGIELHPELINASSSAPSPLAVALLLAVASVPGPTLPRYMPVSNVEVPAIGSEF